MENKIVCHGCWQGFRTSQGLTRHFRAYESCRDGHEAYLTRQNGLDNGSNAASSSSDSLVGDHEEIDSFVFFQPEDNDDPIVGSEYVEDFNVFNVEKEDNYDDKEHNDLSSMSAASTEHSNTDDDLIMDSIAHSSELISDSGHAESSPNHGHGPSDISQVEDLPKAHLPLSSYGPELDRHVVEPSLTPEDVAGISLMHRLREKKFL